MKVLITQNSRSFGQDPRTHYAGDEVELDDEVAKEMIDSGNAEEIKAKKAEPEEEPAPEPGLPEGHYTIKPVESADKPQ